MLRIGAAFTPLRMTPGCATSLWSPTSVSSSRLMAVFRIQVQNVDQIQKNTGHFLVALDRLVGNADDHSSSAFAQGSDVIGCKSRVNAVVERFVLRRVDVGVH